MKLPRPSKGIVAVIIACHLGVPAWGAVVPSGSRLGVMQLGEVRGSDTRRALTLVEQRLLRWLEDSSLVRMPVQRIRQGVRLGDINLEKSRLELHAKLLALQPAGSLVDISRPEVREAIRSLSNTRRQLPASFHVGSDVQMALLWEAALDWSEGVRVRAGELVHQAIVMHPNGNPGIDRLTRKMSGLKESSGFLKMVSDGVSSDRRECTLLIDIEDPTSEISVNDFRIENGRQIHLSQGNSSIVTMSLPDGRYFSRWVSCERPGIKEWTVEPGDNRLQAEQTVFDRHAKAGIRSFCLIRLNEDQFHFLLLTPGVSLDEIPLEKPIRVADVLQYPLGASLPIVSDAFAGLIKKHRLDGLSVVSSDSRGLLSQSSSSSAERVESSSQTQWYNNWTLWVLVGGVAAGVLTAYLASRDSAIQSQSNKGVVLRFD